MSQFSLKVGEIKGLKGDIEKLKQEMETKDERVAQFQKENQSLQERVNNLKTRLRGKGLLQGAKHIIWDSIVVEAAKFRVYLCNIPDIKSMQNRNKMLAMANKQQYNQSNTTIIQKIYQNNTRKSTLIMSAMFTCLFERKTSS
jgi:FtsZ-binding cell division protein ZapB